MIEERMLSRITVFDTYASAPGSGCAFACLAPASQAEFYSIANREMATPKYPRVMVSAKRHAKLAKEAKVDGLTIQELAERKFKIAEEATQAAEAIKRG